MAVVGDILQPTHLLLLLIVALVVLGPKRLPEAGRALGNGLRDFRAAISGESSRDEQPAHEELLRADAPDPYVQEAQPTSEPVATSLAITEPAETTAAEPVRPAPVVEAAPVQPAPAADSPPISRSAPSPQSAPSRQSAPGPEPARPPQPAPIATPTPVAEPVPVEPAPAAEPASRTERPDPPH